MKHMNVNDKPTKYGSVIFWLDRFIKLFVKQKDNNIWIMTITIPNPDGCATSKYHTYCLTIGKSRNDHQAVIDFYLKEVATLTKGVILFDPFHIKYIKVQMGLITYITNRPERHVIVHQSQAGVFSKRTLWSACIDKNNLPYFDKCFAKEVFLLLGDRHSDSPLLRCGRCCQWDMESSLPSNKNSRPLKFELHKNIKQVQMKITTSTQSQTCTQQVVVSS
jgi:hypothetical protein